MCPSSKITFKTLQVWQNIFMNICLNNKPEFASTVFVRPAFLAFCKSSHQLSPVQKWQREGEAAAHTHINMKMTLPGGGGISSLWYTDLSRVAGCFLDSKKTAKINQPKVRKLKLTWSKSGLPLKNLYVGVNPGLCSLYLLGEEG